MTPQGLLALIFVVGALIALIQVGVISLALDKLGLSPESAVLLLLVSALGSLINLPLFRIRAEAPPPDVIPPRVRLLLQGSQPAFTGHTIIAINVGGGLVPLLFCIYLLRHQPLPAMEVLLGITAVTAICYSASRPVPGIGIGMPFFVAPIAAAIMAMLLNPAQSAELAYISGTLGVLIGADILRLKDIGKMGAPVAAIGGAGTFDGIFITGIVAVLLA